MGYLDYAGLQYLWGKLKEKFASKSHTHDDRYYTEAEVNSKLSGKVDNTEAGANGLINKLESGTAAPVDDDLIITQWANHTTATAANKNKYVRRPMSSIWSYIKGKADGVYQPKGSYAASGHTHDDRYYTEAEIDGKLSGKATISHTHDDRYYTESEVDTKLGTKASSDHTHGLNSSSLTKTVDNVTTNSWDMVGGNKDFLLRSLRMQAKAPDWLEGSYAAGIAFGGSDTKGVISHAYNAPNIKFAGGNGAAPVWWLRLTGTSGKTYNLNAMPPASHTHTKDQVGLGNVDNTADKNKSVASAAKLTTTRTVSGGSDITLSFNYDGSGNSTANIGFYSCKHNVDNTNNYPFHRFARLDVNKGAWVDKSITFLISQDFSGGGYGICRLVYRSNADSGSASVDAQWLVRRGFSADTIQVAIKTDKTNGAYCDAFYKSSGTYMGVVIRAIASGGRATSGRTWTLVDSNEVGGTTATDKKTSSECWKTIADAGTALHKQAYSASAPAKDEGYVASAGSANTSSSCAGNSASATKLTSSAGSATQPVYFKDGKPVAGTYTLGDASSKTVRTLGAVGNTGWANKTTDDKYIPTMSFMAYWNGAYSGTSSNLQYCDRGRFGTIVTKGSGDYAAAGHTHNYAGSGSAGGSANSAVKLDSNAGSSVQPVYFSGGKPVAIGYTISSSVPANAKFTDTTYGVASSSSNGLMSSTDKTKLDDFSRVISIQKQIKLTTDWLDTGIAGNSLDTGTYVVQVSGFNSSYTQLYSEIYSGVMSWYSGTTNSGNSSEIFLHNAGLADNNNAIYLRTLRVAGNKTLKLQIACKVAATGTDTLTFKFRRLI